MVNPFKLDIRSSQPELMGLADSIQDFGQQQAAKEELDYKRNRFETFKQRAAEAGADPVMNSQVALEFPEYSEAVKLSFGFANDATEKYARNAYRQAILDPENATTHLERGIQLVDESGGEPVNMVTDLGRLISSDPEEVAQGYNNLELGFAIAYPEDYKNLVAARNIDKPKLEIGDLKGINADITGFTKGTEEINKAYNALSSLQEKATPTDQLAAVFKFMKALDPTSSVRESEQGQVYDAQGAAKGIAAKLNQLIGQGGITEENFQDIVGTAYKLASSDVEDTASQVSRYLDTYEGRMSGSQRSKFEGRIPNVSTLPAPPKAVSYLNSLKGQPGYEEAKAQFKAKYKYLPEGS